MTGMKRIVCPVANHSGGAWPGRRAAPPRRPSGSAPKPSTGSAKTGASGSPRTSQELQGAPADPALPARAALAQGPLLGGLHAEHRARSSTSRDSRMRRCGRWPGRLARWAGYRPGQLVDRGGRGGRWTPACRRSPCCRGPPAPVAEGERGERPLVARDAPWFLGLGPFSASILSEARAGALLLGSDPVGGDAGGGCPGLMCRSAGSTPRRPGCRPRVRAVRSARCRRPARPTRRLHRSIPGAPAGLAPFGSFRGIADVAMLLTVPSGGLVLGLREEAQGLAEGQFCNPLQIWIDPLAS